MAVASGFGYRRYVVVVIKLGSNTTSLQAQRRLSSTTSELSRVYERLASGARINRASDDAAGIAIADRLGTNARLYAVAGRNVNDGISVVNIASGALTNQTGILTRLAELAEQSANGTFSDNQRGALSKEYRALLDEYARIGDTTEFNGVKLLRGSRADGIASFAIQVGVTSTLNSIISIATGDSSSLSGQIAVSSLADTDTNDDGVVGPLRL